MTTQIPRDLIWCDERELVAILDENPNTGYPTTDAVITEVTIGVRVMEAELLRMTDKPKPEPAPKPDGPVRIPTGPWKPPAKPGR